MNDVREESMVAQQPSSKGRSDEDNAERVSSEVTLCNGIDVLYQLSGLLIDQL
jgi:hypothetical protein